MNQGKSPFEVNLVDHLTALERSVITPIVPGELGSWLSEVDEASRGLTELLQNRIEKDHERLFKAICKADMELAGRVQQMEADAADLQQEHKGVLQLVAQLEEARNRSGSDEVLLAEQLEDLKRAAQSVVLKARTLEAAVTTWHDESLRRDRGPVD